MSIEAAIDIGWDVLQWIVVPIKRQFKYVISSKSYAQDLKQEVGTLVSEVERVQPIVEEANNNLRNINPDVPKWQASAEKAMKEAEQLGDNFEKVSKNCCYGTLPDPIIRYRFSRKAKETIADIQKLALEGKEFKEMNNISSSRPAPGKVAASTLVVRVGEDVVQSTPAAASASSSSMSVELGNDGIFKSRALIIREIMDALADNNHMVVGVHGMGGVGKSTLLEDAERKIKEKKSFDWIAKADVSKTPDIRRIQGEIADALGLGNIMSKESISGRAQLLRERLEKEERENKKVLIILDNLWERLVLKSVGIPSGDNNKVKGCKLLLTSRNLTILQREMGCDKDFPLLGLEKEEARVLFEKMVGPKVHDEEFKPWVEKALHKCAGVPFLIDAMANRLKNAELGEWRDTLRKILKFQDKNINKAIDDMLQWSYDELEEEVKLLLQLCVVYAISKPSLENLVRYGFGLGLFKEVSSMEEARDRLNSHIHILQDSSLLLKSEDADSFKIHDLVSEFVASVALRDHPLLVLKDVEKSIIELPTNTVKSWRAICFPYVDMKELPEELDGSELEVFLLFTNNASLSVPDSYFNSMRKLMVLDLSGIRLTRLPSSFGLLESLHTLCLNRCVLDNVATLGELKGLQILNLANSEIERLPKEIGNLVELRLLDLSSCYQLRIIEPGVLGSMTKLEELYMLNSFHAWDAMEQTPRTNASFDELNNKKNLRTLHVYIPDLSVLPEDTSFEKLTKYQIHIGKKFPWFGKSEGLRTLDLMLNPTDNIIHKGYLSAILDRTDELFLDGIDQNICELSREGFPKLKHLHVQNSPSIRYILQQPTSFKTLESLVLQDLVNLKKISNNNVSSNSFSALEVVRVQWCDRMEALFPFSVVRKFPQLKKMEVVDCMLTQGIVEAGDGGKVEWPNLHELILRNLPCMKNFFTSGMAPSSSTSDNQNGTQIAFFNGQQVAFPNLETLKIDAMGNIEMIWNNHVHFGHLKTLHVSHCDKLSHIFTPTIVGNLVELTRLTIERCNILTEVIVDEGGDASCVVTFKKLKYLELLELTGLSCFNSGGRTLMFPILEDVIMIRCLNMKFFSKGPIEAPKLEIVRLAKYDMVCMGNLNCSTPYLFGKMAVVGVQKLWLSEFPELIETWHNELIPINSSWQLYSLVVDKCSSFINAIPSRRMLILENMSNLHVCNCELLEEIFDLEGLNGVESTRVLPSLSHLYLVNLPKLRRLWNNDLQGRLCFSHLRNLSLYKCDDLKYVFTPSVARSLDTLNIMEIKECGLMECVIFEEEGQGSATEEITFPQLWEMELERLPKLTSFLLGKNFTLEFSELEDLTITHCPKMRSLIGQSSMEIEQGTPSLFATQVQFPLLRRLTLSHMDSVSNIWINGLTETHISESLQSVDIQNCKSLEYLFPHWFANSLNDLRKLRVESCEFMELIMSKDETPCSIATQVLLPKLTSLVLHEMPQLKSFCPNLSTLKLPSLKELRVTHCHELQMSSPMALMNKWTQRDEEQHLPIERDFPELKKLVLDKDDIKRIQDGNLADDIYGKPVGLTLACFHDEKDVFPSSSLLERFHNLKSLDIFCSSFEDIFPNDEPIEQREYPVLENLTKLKLSKLHNLRRVWSKDCLVSKIFQSIKTFEVRDCPGLTTLFPTVTSFQKLTKLVVQNCSGLIHVFTVSDVTHLVHLRKMTIIGCEGMQEVMANDGNGEGKVISFESLEYMKLQNLPSLLCFSSDTSCVCRFPSLRTVIVEECPKMKIFSRGVLSTPNRYYASLFRCGWEMREDTEEGDLDLNTVIQKLSA